MKNILTMKSLKTGSIAVFSILISSLLYFVNQSSVLFQTSVVDLPQHEAFNGTVYPVQKVPDWMNLDSSKWDLPYESFDSSELLDIPFYDPVQLAVNPDTLSWGDAEDNKTRNAKITYSVPYLGSYELDGVENAGSHPAVDIKIPKNTPIYAIANGVVIKAVKQSTGFGNHIVIQHNDFPTLDDSNASETIYSSYNHMNSLLVKEGEIVTKGQLIGKSGDSGTSTTPHIHFQIDNDSVDWHPYWPFSSAEASAAGYNFYSAINNGFGQAKARAATINPLKFVQKYMDDSIVIEEKTTESDDSQANSTTNANSYIPSVVESEESTVNEELESPEELSVDDRTVPLESSDPIEFDTEKNQELNFDIIVRKSYVLGQSFDFEIKLVDQNKEPYIGGFSGDLVVKKKNNHIKIKYPIVNYRLFENQVYNNSFEVNSLGKERIVIEYDGEKYFSDWFDVVEASKSDFAFSDLSPNHKYYEAIMYLADKGIVAGYPDKTFKPDKTVTRVESLKFILEGIDAHLTAGGLPFDDVSAKEWYSKYLFTAYKDEIVDGYADRTFRPSNTVNKAEFYKILFNGMKIDINPIVKEDPFNDVSKDEWYAHFVAYAKEIGIIDPRIKNLNASKGMTRGEVAYAIYKVMKMD